MSLRRFNFLHGVLRNDGLVDVDELGTIEAWVLSEDGDREPVRIDKAYLLREPLSRLTPGRRMILLGKVAPGRPPNHHLKMLYVKDVYVQEELDTEGN